MQRAVTSLTCNGFKHNFRAFLRLFKGLEDNTRLEVLSMSNVGLTDRTAELLAQAIEKNSSVRVIK